ncbi:hypothetical protein Hamer_G018051, partial [Homarus americanus]
HPGCHQHDYVNNLAKYACTLPISDDASTIIPGRVKTFLKKVALHNINEERERMFATMINSVTQNINIVSDVQQLPPESDFAIENRKHNLRHYILECRPI